MWLEGKIKDFFFSNFWHVIPNQMKLLLVQH